ncbi:MAG: FAD-dependent oxidoreductase [Acidimicrobiia bacterium]|nr:FAD-dependent oxidoreductase [Acidimicrobiia bacterium]
MGGRIGDRAVVLGGGMAGLLAARVLAGRYREVVVVDRDDLSGGPAPRRGAAQGRHAHAPLAGGQRLLEELFPGLTAQLGAEGAPVGDVLADTRMYLSGHRLRPAPSGMVVVSASRPLLESHIRARVADLEGVEVLDRCDVVGLSTSPGSPGGRGGRGGGQVTGARLLRRFEGSAPEVLEGDLVVDATGRASRAAAWLDALGVDGPDEDRVQLDVAYATRRYRLAPGAMGDDLAVLIGPTPRHPRAGVLARLEGGQAMLTLAGVLGDRPPIGPDGFAEFAAGLHFSDIHEALCGAEPLDDPVPYRFPASVWRHYERLGQLPGGFVVLGDSMCSLNPVYGQGMTVAARQAMAVRRHLDRHGRARARLLHRELARVVSPTWQMAAGADLAFPGALGRRNRLQGALGRYVTRLHAAAAHDPSLATSFVRVSGLVDSPTALLRPGVVGRVLGHRPRAAERHEPVPPPTLAQ